MKSPFGNVVLVTLFKCCENMCKGKSVVGKSIVEICVVLFKQRKLSFKQDNLTGPKYLLGCKLFEQILNSFGIFQLGFSIVILKEAKEHICW